MRSNMHFGVNLIPTMEMSSLISWWRAAEEGKFEFIGVPDSPMLSRELYASCMACALSTDKVKIAPMVSNPVSRHPSVAASALLALNDVAPGRIRFGIGVGDSAVFSIGEQGATVQDVRDYINAVKGLHKGEEVEWKGKRFAPMWKQFSAPVDVPIYVSCHAPKITKMAAQVADGVISGMGVLPENVQSVHDLVSEGASEVNRKSEDVDIWWHPIVYLAESKEEALFNMGSGGAHFLTRSTMDGKQIPPDLRDPIRKLAETWNPGYSGGVIEADVAKLAKDLGVADYLFERGGALGGTAKDITEGLKKLQDRNISQVMLLLRGGDELDVLNTLGREVLTNF